MRSLELVLYFLFKCINLGWIEIRQIQFGINITVPF